eukprot:6475484-Prymnesium_polylepis.1
MRVCRSGHDVERSGSQRGRVSASDSLEHMSLPCTDGATSTQRDMFGRSVRTWRGSVAREGCVRVCFGHTECGVVGRPRVYTLESGESLEHLEH